MGLVEGKIAIVTASTRGIGRACALKLAEEGAKVYVAARNRERSMELVEEIRAAGGQADFVRFDADDHATYSGCVNEVLAAEGRLDILVNNYGATDVKRDFDVEHTKFDDFQEIVMDNVRSVFDTAQAAIKGLAEGATLSIVNVSSTGGVYPDLSRESYGVAKSAIIRMTKDIAIQNARRGVRCNVVCPGSIATDALMDNMSDELIKSFLTTIPMNRLGEPSEIADVVLFYASDMSSYVTGSVMEVGGGTGLGTPMYPLYQMMAARG
ncbi:MAG: SDR family NAD(P)-dependent oxidoreductase [Collinsella sp.]|nr:SDR family NAD(P)-dependent oxidoreductase [Collinsella sp.]